MHLNFLNPYRFKDRRNSSLPPKHYHSFSPKPKQILTYDRQVQSKRLVDEATANNKIFMLQGPYPAVREFLRKNGWVERFYNFSIYRKRFASLRSTDETSDVMIDGDGNAIDLEDHGSVIAPWKEDGGFYGFMSRLVEKSEPNLFWGVRRDVFDVKIIGPEQMMNHYANAVFTSKTGLCKHLKELTWYAEGTCNVFYPRTYQLAKLDEREAFEYDFCFTASVSLLVNLIDCHSDKTISKDPVYNVPEHIVLQALEMCKKHLAFLNHEDIDTGLGNEFSTRSMDEMLDAYYHSRDVVVTSEVINVLALEIEQILEDLSLNCPQFNIDGKKNVWILKPGAKSRGRGIQIFNDLKEILKLVEHGIYINEKKYVIQKYIERPLLIHKTKFDIRQWFLVTSWNPLTIWFYKDSYLRFCSQEFTLDDFDLSIHLTNNSIQKYYSNGERSEELPDDNMWTCHHFKEYLSKIGAPENVWEDVIYKGMKKSIIDSLLCFQEIVEQRKNSFELFGADFMLSEGFHPWLIEINSSPCMSPSTNITASLCPRVLEDTLKVVLDKSQGTGLFELIYKQNFVLIPNFLGTNLLVKGKMIYGQARHKMMQKSKNIFNMNKNSKRLLCRRKKKKSQTLQMMFESSDTSSSESSSSSSSLSCYGGVNNNLIDQLRPREKKIKDTKKKQKKAWNNRCSKCKRNGRIKCLCGVTPIKALNLLLTLEDGVPKIHSESRVVDYGHEKDSSTLTSRIFKERKWRPSMSVSGNFLDEDESSEMYHVSMETMAPLANDNIVSPQPTSSNNLDIPPDQRAAITQSARRSTGRVHRTSLSHRSVVDPLTRRRTALDTFINQLSLRPAAVKINLSRVSSLP